MISSQGVGGCQGAPTPEIALEVKIKLELDFKGGELDFEGGGLACTPTLLDEVVDALRVCWRPHLKGWGLLASPPPWELGSTRPNKGLGRTIWQGSIMLVCRDVHRYRISVGNYSLG
ncbi:hypothetical protein CRG98_018130 [Punica granatum]|uniref:Uncharacterized protein n=1 Tax=Punica granatum TaxID=22663 RepID=A0A2I0JYM2_PUNGR|nr:hypothetical protein CRG98_018130 [Punica granatum]